MGAIIRHALPSDIEAVMRLAEAVPASARWPQTAYDAYCAEGPESGELQRKVLFVAHACSAHPAGGTDIALQFAGAERSTAVGFAAFAAVAGARECELENMAVAEAWRRRGIGRRLLNAGLLWSRMGIPAAVSGFEMWLEVRASNRAAIALYRDAGFRVIGRRTGYYTQPDEDALLMRKSGA